MRRWDRREIREIGLGERRGRGRTIENSHWCIKNIERNTGNSFIITWSFSNGAEDPWVMLPVLERVGECWWVRGWVGRGRGGGLVWSRREGTKRMREGVGWCAYVCRGTLGLV